MVNKQNLAITLLILSILLGCTRTLTVETDSGKIMEIEVERKQILSTSTLIESKSEPEILSNINRSCSGMGICCKCGMTMNLDHECSCGVWRNCPGTRKAKVKVTILTVRDEYTINKNGRKVIYKTPARKQKQEEELESSQCILN